MNQAQNSTIENAAAEAPAASMASRPTSVPLWHTRYGIVQANHADDVIARSLAKYGEWAEQELDVIGTLLDEGSIALQYGAEYGVHALYLSNLVGEGGQVHIAEPRRLEHIALCTSVALNNLRNVYPHHAALGERDARWELPVSEGQPEERTHMVRVDSLELSNVHLLKINPPGVLLPLLTGAAETLRQHKPAIYFRLSTMDLAVAEVEALKARGYRCWSHLPYLYNSASLSGNKLNIFPGWVHQNVIAVHRDMPAEFGHLPEL
jgi:FkbM family methyltransferase